MASKKTYEILELLRELASGREVSVKNYAAQTGLSERTIRRYLEDVREIFGEGFVKRLSRGSYVCENSEFFRVFTDPNELQNESEKLIDMLHIVNPTFSRYLPPAQRKLDDKLAKEPSEIFLIKGSPRENTPDLAIFGLLRQAIKFRRYSNLKYDGRELKRVKILKLIFSKGNWSVATLIEERFEALRAAFVEGVELTRDTFYLSDYDKNFVANLESLFGGYKKEPVPVRVALSPRAEKYFLKKTFFRSQRLTEEHAKNGWRVAEFALADEKEIVMLARHWFPDFVILEPKSARESFDEALRDYFKFEKECLE